MVLYLLVVTMLHLIFRKRTDRFKKYIQDFRYNAILRFLIESYLPFMVSALISVSYVSFREALLLKGDLNNNFEISSIICSGFVIILLILMFMGSLTLFLTRFKEINDEKQK